MPDAHVTDRRLLTDHAYGTDRHLAARQSLYRFQQPTYDLPSIVAEQLPTGSGIVADVGCGNGRYVRYLRQSRPDLTVIGIDLAAGILTAVEPPVVVADAAALPLPDRSTAAVLAMHMLYHLPDIDAGLGEMCRVLAPDGVLVASTNARRDKAELDHLWVRAAADVLGTAEAPHRVSLSSRFPLDDAPAHLSRFFAKVTVIDLPGTITVTDPEPVLAHLGSYRAWAHQTGVPFDATLDRARQHVERIIDREGAFRITCHGGILVCHAAGRR